jgi:putative heme-binding domain-containing protein
MLRSPGFCPFLFLFLIWCPACVGDEFHGLRVPPGFEITEYADSKLANDIFCMTLDPRGRVVVSGRGYVRLLVDDNGDGKAARAIDLGDGPKDGAQGLLWEGDWLYFTGDGGLRRWRIKHDKTDGPSELIRALRTGGEHEAHAIQRGPDGWLYVLCGNSTGIDKGYATLPTSPIKEPTAGCVLRFSPDLKESEIIADGLRNAYALDFTLDGELVTFDSDNERCVSMPWYEPTRFYHVIPGGHYGWLSPQRVSFWRMPAYFCDVVPPIGTLGRGSPTGVVCYRHSQFPDSYRGGVFLADWTFGRIWYLSLRRCGSTYSCEKRLFLEAVGENGFAPTALAVHPTTGDLYVSIGGRGTRGAVYRIRHSQGFKALGATARAKRVPPRSLDWKPSLLQELPRQASADDASLRHQALLALLRHRAHFEIPAITQAILANWDTQDRLIRQAAANLLGTLRFKDRQALAESARTARKQITYCLAVSSAEHADVVARASRILAARGADVDLRLAAVRLIQCALGDISAPKLFGTVWEGYSPRHADWPMEVASTARSALRSAFPTGCLEIDREISRTLAILQDEDADSLMRMAERITESSDPVEDIHYLIVLARFSGPRSEILTKRIARALLALDEKLTQRHLNRDTNWPLRLVELHAELARQDPNLNASLLAADVFGRPDHALFTECPGFDRRRAAEIFLARSSGDVDYPWTPPLVRLLGELPEEKALVELRRLWERGGLEETIVQLLARRPQLADRSRFLEGLNSPNFATVRLCLDALDKLPPDNDNVMTLALIRALRALPDGREENQLSERISKQLRRVTGQEKLGADKQAWTAWLTRAHPDLAAKLGGTDGVDMEGWTRRLAKLDWSAGDAERGRSVYSKASCASCHSGAQALGPDLRGVAGRFSRDDLFTAILQPSKDISPRYRTTLVATADGKTYQGLVIYDAVDSLLLQTGPATTVRLTNPQIAARRITQKSLMPPGLLDKLTDREIADLYAYLKTLGKPTGDRR